MRLVGIAHPKIYQGFGAPKMQIFSTIRLKMLDLPDDEQAHTSPILADMILQVFRAQGWYPYNANPSCLGVPRQ